MTTTLSASLKFWLSRTLSAACTVRSLTFCFDHWLVWLSKSFFFSEPQFLFHLIIIFLIGYDEYSNPPFASDAGPQEKILVPSPCVCQSDLGCRMTLRITIDLYLSRIFCVCSVFIIAILCVCVCVSVSILLQEPAVLCPWSPTEEEEASCCPRTGQNWKISLLACVHWGWPAESEIAAPCFMLTNPPDLFLCCFWWPPLFLGLHMIFLK